MSDIVCGKRSNSIFDELLLDSPPVSKRIRFSPGASSPTAAARFSPPRASPNGGAAVYLGHLARLRSLFPGMYQQRTLQNEKQCWAHAKAARKKLLHECGGLHRRLNECSVNVLAEDEDKFIITPSMSDALYLLATSDNRIGLLLAEAQLLGQDDEFAVGGMNKTRNSEPSGNPITINGDESMVSDDQLRKVLADTLIDNARLRKQVNSVIRCAIKNVEKPEKDDRDDIPSRKYVLNRFLSS